MTPGKPTCSHFPAYVLTVKMPSRKRLLSTKPGFRLSDNVSSRNNPSNSPDLLHAHRLTYLLNV